MSRIIPNQIRAVDPYEAYNSDVVNKLSRVVSNNKNVIIRPEHFKINIINPHIISISKGICIIYDVTICVTDEVQVDLTNIDAFYGPNHDLIEGYYYVILDYHYSKTRPAKKLVYYVISPLDINPLFNANVHVLIGVVHVNSNLEIDNVFTYDPNDLNVKKPICESLGVAPNLSEQPEITDTWIGKLIYFINHHNFYYLDNNEWTNILSKKYILSGSQPYGKILITDGSGSIFWVNGVITYHQEITNASEIWNINHNLNSNNIIVRVFKNSTPNKETIPKKIEITSDNDITIYFSKPTAGKVVLIACYI